MRGITKYCIVVGVFIVAMAVKVYTDLPHWQGSIASYLASTLIIIPVIWYAGYFFHQAEVEHRNKLIDDLVGDHKPQ